MNSFQSASQYVQDERALSLLNDSNTNSDSDLGQGQ